MALTLWNVCFENMHISDIPLFRVCLNHNNLFITYLKDKYLEMFYVFNFKIGFGLLYI